jgi:hypothetical protein
MHADPNTAKAEPAVPRGRGPVPNPANPGAMPADVAHLAPSRATRAEADVVVGWWN